MAQERHPDYFETGVPEGKQALPIESVREVQRVASIKPVLADRRVFVIRDAESMSAEAANCFLKTLEEPPGGCLLILIASGLRQIPATILSRCRLVRFRNMPPDALQRELEAEQVEPAQARWLARRAWGSPGLARQLLEMGLPEFNNRMLEELRTLSPEDNFRLSDWVNEAASSRSQGTAESRAVLQDLLECLALYYRDLALAAAAAGGTAELCNAALADQARELTAGRQAEFFASQADLVLEAIERVGGNANRQLALDWLFTRLGRAQTAGTKGTA
jgi:DNA polymerase-3 subunit delta'